MASSSSAVSKLTMKLLEKKHSVAVEELNRKVRDKLKEMKVQIANKLKIRIREAMEEKLGKFLEQNYDSIIAKLLEARKKAKEPQRQKVRPQRGVKRKRGSHPVRIRATKVKRVRGVTFDKQYCDLRRKPFWKCADCSKRFWSLSGCQYHKKVHSGIKSHRCNECPKRFIMKCQLKKHQLAHRENKPFKCHLCPKQYFDKINLTDHQWHHSGVKRHVCIISKKPITTFQGREYHYFRHLGLFFHKCSDCQKRFATKSEVKKHKLIHGARNFSCQICNVTFKQPSVLGNHLVVHSDEFSFQCKTCDKKFKRKWDLKAHELTHDVARNFKCDQCGVEQLLSHEVIHSDEKWKWKCDLCNQIFKQKGGLTVHKKLHEGIKPHDCHQCGKCFATKRKNVLTRHLQVHSFDKPFKCSTYDKSFKGSAGLKKHEKSLHKV